MSPNVTKCRNGWNLSVAYCLNGLDQKVAINKQLFLQHRFALKYKLAIVLLYTLTRSGLYANMFNHHSLLYVGFICKPIFQTSGNSTFLQMF